MTSPVTFQLLRQSPTTAARLGRVTTPHGVFDTPAFMPVGTRGTVKGLLPHLVAQTGAQIILANTYHLMLRPGSELIQKLGGLHAFTNWSGPMLTDSGGYQAYSMAGINRVTDDGVTFQSLVDGASVTLTPESATRIQNELGADIIMAFDDCPPSIDPEQGPVNQTRLRLAAMRDAKAMNARPNTKGKKSKAYDHAARLQLANQRTIRWLERCRAEHHRLAGHTHRALFGIVQGGTDLAQRSWSAERVCNVDLPGYAIGGVAVGESFPDIQKVVAHTAPLLPESKPRYLMGVGYECDLLAAVLSGVDMFDCVLPTRNGRNANAFTSTGQIRLRNAQYQEDPRPIEEGCDCLACAGPRECQGPLVQALSMSRTPNTSQSASPASGFPNDSGFSRAYIRHLFLAKEMLGPILVSLHNVRHFQRFMADIRSTIAVEGTGGGGGGGGAKGDDWDGLLRRWPVARPPSSSTHVPSVPIV